MVKAGRQTVFQLSSLTPGGPTNRSLAEAELPVSPQSESDCVCFELSGDECPMNQTREIRNLSRVID